MARWSRQRSSAVERMLWDFSTPSAALPAGHAQEALSAISMLAPPLYSLWRIQWMPDTVECPSCAWMFVLAGVAHLPFSIAYHVVCGLIAQGHKIDDTPFRCGDQGMVHFVCVVCSWSISRSFAYMALVALPFNLFAVFALLTRARTEERHWRFIRMGCAVFIYLVPMCWRGDWWNFFGAGASFCVVSALFAGSHLLAGFGHPLMHLMLTPYTHCVLMSAMG
mmetsp:Transcript_61686/g.138987  ORF Transcript_61686/g.138987 Transcript_61686/m.138987 type:complete len:222 (-) Transcript_61686:14-679(-)